MMNEKKDILKAVFLDRDGTINNDENGYICKEEDFLLFPFASKAIKLLNDAGFLVIIVTNQSGVARGYYTFSDIENVHSKMRNELAKVGAKIDDIFISPYHEDGAVEPYNVSHEDRKPEIGLFKKALEKYDFNIKKSFMVGDKYSDITFGINSHLKTILVKTGNGGKEFMNREYWIEKPDFVVENLMNAVKIILEIDENEK